MRSSKSKNKRSFYISLFLTLTFSIVVTILVLSTILYFNFENIVTGQIYSYILSNLQQTSQGAVMMKINTSTLAKQIFLDEHISKLRNYTSVDHIELNTAIKQMGYYRATSPFIESIYIYNRKSGVFYISSELGENSVQNKLSFYDREIIDLLESNKDSKNLDPIPRRIQVAYPNPVLVNVYTFILRDGIGYAQSDSVIIINYSERYLNKDIEGVMVNSGSSTFTVNSEGMLVSESWKYPMLFDASGLDYIKKAMLSKSAGYFISDVDGEKSFIAHTAPDVLGWRYIKIVPYREITGNIAKMRVFTIIAGFIILGIGLTVSYLLSRKLSTDVDKRLSKLKILESESHSNLNRQRTEYLRKLLLCEEKQELEYVAREFENLHIPMNAEGWFVILLIKIDQYGEFTKRYEGSDRSLFKFAIMNIVQETLSPNYRVMTVDMNEDRIAVFLNITEVPNTSVMFLESAIKEMQALVLKYLEISVSVVLSSSTDTAENLGHLYSQVVEASFYRMFYGHKCIIHTEKVLELESNQYEYPVLKEKLLINELMLGKIEDTMKLVKEIIDDTANYPYAAFNIAVAHLTYAVSDALCVLRKRNLSNAELNVNSIFQRLNHVETVEDIYNHFMSIFSTMVSMLDDGKNSKHDDIVNKAIKIIDSEYMDQDLSLESIADALGMTSTYIGRLFKRHTTKTILDYIIEVRMQKSRQLLADTELSVGEIAEKTGFSNSPYFYKAFKKAHGVTPAEYRKSEKILKSTSV